jgi:hypothetical protein
MDDTMKMDTEVLRESDLAELRRGWQASRQRMQEILRRFDVRGMTRPARDSDENEWLGERREGWFVEDERAATAARAYYARKYQR